MLATADISEKTLTIAAATPGCDAALDQVGCLMQADAGLHRIDQHGI